MTLKHTLPPYAVNELLQPCTGCATPFWRRRGRTAQLAQLAKKTLFTVRYGYSRTAQLAHGYDVYKKELTCKKRI
jgi:hypothetical protein